MFCKSNQITIRIQYCRYICMRNKSQTYNMFLILFPKKKLNVKFHVNSMFTAYRKIRLPFKTKPQKVRIYYHLSDYVCDQTLFCFIKKEVNNIIDKLTMSWEKRKNPEQLNKLICQCMNKKMQVYFNKTTFQQYKFRKHT